MAGAPEPAAVLPWLSSLTVPESGASTAGRRAGGTTLGMAEADGATGPPQTMPHGPQQPVTQTHAGERLASASRNSFCTSVSAGVTSAAVASTSDAGPGLFSWSSAAPFRISALGARPLITSAASVHRIASSSSPSLSRTAARFCATARRKSSSGRGAVLRSFRAKRRRSPPASPTQIAWSDPRSLRKYSSNIVKALMTTPKKPRRSYSTRSPTLRTLGWGTTAMAWSQSARASM
mmetsp:Transcript_84332/g.239028  ORF Transcript_84332/g.239028 Transcript_84332/m.239028 type:complete len:235 (+) Transcript_84332:390-1094(+)